MDIVLWVLQIVLAVVFVGAGTAKLVVAKDKLPRPQLAWTEDFSAGTVKLIGAAELLGGLGLVLPPLLDVATVLTPLAATGLAVVMAGAFVTHLRRGEKTALPPPVVLFVLAVVVAWGRFGPYAF